MIPANPQRWADAVFRLYLTWIMKRSFSRIILLQPAPQLPADQPVLLLPNHSSWWDGFFVYLLNKRLFHRQVYLMMLERQLRRYPFFNRLGAYSVNPGRPKSVLASLDYTLGLLKQEKVLITIFPQGELRRGHCRPLGYQRLPEWLLQRTSQPVTVLPLAIWLGFLEERKPAVIMKLGSPRSIDNRNAPKTAELEQEMSELLDDIYSLSQGELQGEILLRGIRGMSDR